MAITRIQSKAANVGAATAASLTVTLDANATVGNFLIIGACTSGNSTLIVSSGASTQTRALTLSGFDNTGNCLSVLSYLPVTTAAADVTIQNVNGNSLSFSVIAVEYSANNLVPGILGGTANGTGTSNATASITTTGASALLVAIFAVRSQYSSEQTGWLTSITSSFSSVAQTSSSINTTNADRGLCFAERIVTAAGTYSTAGTQASLRHSNALGSFKEIYTFGGVTQG